MWACWKDLSIWSNSHSSPDSIRGLRSPHLAIASPIHQWWQTCNFSYFLLYKNNPKPQLLIIYMITIPPSNFSFSSLHLPLLGLVPKEGSHQIQSLKGILHHFPPFLSCFCEDPPAAALPLHFFCFIKIVRGEIYFPNCFPHVQRSILSICLGYDCAQHEFLDF